MRIHDPENQHPIDTLWAFLSRDSQGMEGIIAVEDFAFVTGDPKIRDLMRMKLNQIDAHGLTSKKIIETEFRRVPARDESSQYPFGNPPECA